MKKKNILFTGVFALSVVVIFIGFVYMIKGEMPIQDPYFAPDYVLERYEHYKVMGSRLFFAGMLLLTTTGLSKIICSLSGKKS